MAAAETTQQVVQVIPFWTIIKQTVVSSLPQIIAGFCFFLVFVIVGIIFRVVLMIGAKKGTPRYLVQRLIAKSVLWLIVALGIIVGLGTAGYNVTSLVTSLGLAGFALSFALKDMLSNLLAGAMIIFNQTYKLGDVVTVNGVTGAVVNIDMRYTELQNDEQLILVPNSTLLSAISSIKNKVV